MRSIRLQGVPILVYHGVGPCTGPRPPWTARKYHVPEALLRMHLGELRRLAYQAVLLGDRPLPRAQRQVVLSFDDGRASDYFFAYPALLEASARAHFFVNTAAVGRTGYVDWPQLAEMRRHGMSFQSHGHDHVYLTALSPAERRRQLRLSKEILEDRLGCRVDFLAVPYGDYDGDLLRVAEEAGYAAVCVARPWPARLDSAVLNRVAVYGHTSVARFGRLIRGDPFLYLFRRARAAVLHSPKRVWLYVQPEAIR